MAITHLLDTNIVSEPIRKVPNAHVVKRIRQYAPHIAISAVTWHELLFGLFKMPPSRKRNVVESYVLSTIRSEIQILDYSATAAEWFAQERARLSKIGKTPAYADGQIAATAATHNLILVTRNTTDFADFEGITIENWFA